MNRTVVAWGLVLVAAVLLGWEALAWVVPGPDDEAVRRLAGWNAGVLRWSRPTPSHILSAGSPNRLGEVEAVSLTGEITDEQVGVLLSLRRCRRLCLTRCTFADPGLLPRLGGMTAVEVLMLWHGTVDDPSLAAALPRFGRVEYLYLQDNPLTDAAVGPIAAMPALRAVHIVETRISPAGVARLRQLRPGLKVDTTRPPTH